jgi:hypothetical protein
VDVETIDGVFGQVGGERERKREIEREKVGHRAVKYT